MEGYIKLHRSIMDNEIWTKQTFTWGQAWIDLIMLANHKDTSVWIRGIEVKIKRGQCAWSILNLSRRWLWSRNKTRRFLSWLKMNHQIEQQNNNITTLISIVNYDRYQSNEDIKKDTRRTTKRTPNEPQTINEKNEKNINNIYSLYAEEVLEYLNKKTNKKFGVRNKAEILKPIINRLKSKYTKEELIKIIDLKLEDPWYIENPKYYNPDTLFGSNKKVEKHLNSGNTNNKLIILE